MTPYGKVVNGFLYRIHGTLTDVFIDPTLLQTNSYQLENYNFSLYAYRKIQGCSITNVIHSK